MIEEIAKEAKQASYKLARLPTEVKNRALLSMAETLEKSLGEIIAANNADVDAARARGVRAALLDRLRLSDSRVKEMAQGLRDVAALPDPVGEVLGSWIRPNGLIISQIRVPLGVIGVIYESRPNVAADVVGICLKSGNAAILRGGSDAFNSNLAVVDILSQAASAAGIPEGAIQIIRTTDRKAVLELMQLRDYVDVLIPRGGIDLIKAVADNAKVPVIETGTGNCHIYVDESADTEMATRIVINAKTQRPGTCNAAEKLLVHEKMTGFLPLIVSQLHQAGVEVRGCSQIKSLIPNVVAATEDDWYTEYLDMIIGVKLVKDLDEAIAHINKYGSHHSDAIVTPDFNRALRFMQEVDSAAVYWNASTRFTDGGQFGFGAEMGISTQKMHVRGPFSVQHLTSTKYIIIGRGHIRQ